MTQDLVLRASSGNEHIDQITACRLSNTTSDHGTTEFRLAANRLQQISPRPLDLSTSDEITLGGYMRHLLTFAALAALAACAVLLVSCGGSPEPVAYDQICNQADGKLVQTVGHFAADSSVFCSNIGSSDTRCGLGFTAAPGQKAAFNADVAQGTGRNQVEPIPDDFTPEAIVFHAADGGAIHVGDKVSVTGKLSVAPNVCFIRVDTITKVQ